MSVQFNHFTLVITRWEMSARASLLGFCCLPLLRSLVVCIIIGHAWWFILLPVQAHHRLMNECAIFFVWWWWCETRGCVTARDGAWRNAPETCLPHVFCPQACPIKKQWFLSDLWIGSDPPWNVDYSCYPWFQSHSNYILILHCLFGQCIKSRIHLKQVWLDIEFLPRSA